MSNNSGPGVYNSRKTTYRESMEAYDALPKKIRLAMANAQFNWSAPDMKEGIWCNGKKSQKSAIAFLQDREEQHIRDFPQVRKP